MTTKNEDFDGAVRVTRRHVDEVTRLALEHRFKRDEVRLARAADALARSLYNRATPPALRRLTKELPKNWCSEVLKLRFNVCGLTIELLLLTPLRAPAGYSSYSVYGVVTDAELKDRCERHGQNVAQHEKIKRETSAQLRALLERCSTFRQLDAAWPEGRRFYAALAKRVALPAVNVQVVNESLGLICDTELGAR